jgi:hypothetical protein
MLRRIALIVALLVPIAGLAQTAGQVLITPTAFGTADCTSTTNPVSLTWTSGATIVTGDTYMVWISHTDSACPTTGSPGGSTKLPGGDIPATLLTQSYPSTLLTSDFLADAGVVGCATNATVYVCVQHWQVGQSSAKATATGSASLQVLPPPVPVISSVAPGDTALFVSWDDGPSNGVTAASYDVTAVGSTGTRTQNFTGRSNNRLGGLTNDVAYSVTVVAISAGGNRSDPSLAVIGTPKPVANFWDNYTGVPGHQEQGGCGGGPAGALSLLGVALALRGLRRRS